jgi:putative NADPH-quinone reductase
MPAVLKGFCDKVLLPGWAYTSDENGKMVGLLTGKKAIVITTMQMPTEMYTSQFMDPINGGFIVGTLQFCGIETIKYIQIDNISTGGTEYAESKMNEIRALI